VLSLLAMADFNLMTWNVENVFLPGPGADSERRERFDRKLRQLAATIDAAGPALLALQEVGEAEALQALQQRLERSMPFAALAEPDERGIRCAVLSTLPLTDRRQVPLFPALIRPVQTRDPVFDDPDTPAFDESLTNRLSRAVAATCNPSSSATHACEASRAVASLSPTTKTNATAMERMPCTDGQVKPWPCATG